MNKIRIIQLPDSDHPEDKRRAFVGITIPIDEAAVRRELGKVPDDDRYYVIPLDVVIAMAKADRQSAADYWKKHLGRITSFKKTDCELLET